MNKEDEIKEADEPKISADDSSTCELALEFPWEFIFGLETTLELR